MPVQMAYSEVIEVHPYQISLFTFLLLFTSLLPRKELFPFREIVCKLLIKCELQVTRLLAMVQGL